MKLKCKALKYSVLAAAIGSLSSMMSAADNTQLDLAREEIARYDIEAAREHIDKFLRQGGRRAKPTAEMTAAADSLTGMIDRIEMMLSRVEHIEVVDSIAVDRADFFRHYALSPGAGSLFDASALPADITGAGTGVGYRSPDGRKMIWAQPDASGIPRLVESSALSDDSWEQPVPLPGELNRGGGASYPYMMTDGSTLYFASDGEGSLGGLDIMLTRFDGEQWLEPQNVGMPYNSPYDDYMMAIDELSGAGWWATDRNRLGDKITIYMFRPNDIRDNYPEDTPDIASRALLTSIRDTWRDPAAVDEFMRKFKGAAMRQSTAAGVEHDFSLSLGNGRVYHSLDEFRSPKAREAMEDYLILDDEIRLTLADLNKLREQYSQGDPSCHDDIILLEERIRRLRHQLLDDRNRIITLENQR